VNEEPTVKQSNPQNTTDKSSLYSDAFDPFDDGHPGAIRLERVADLYQPEYDCKNIVFGAVQEAAA
jgi:hypothetical protein